MHRHPPAPPSTIDGTHRRRNALTGEWVLVTTGRDRRPWSGETERTAVDPAPRYDPGCYLCPGNARVTGEVNPTYESTFVFRNDFAALRAESAADRSDDPLFGVAPQTGECRVVCYSPRHDQALADMSVDDITQVVDLWCDQHAELSARWHWVQVFENRGSAMGASNPHPHGQIWAGSSVPTTVTVEDDHQRRYHAEHGRRLLSDYAAAEIGAGDRVVVLDESWVVIVPFWATWPFETLLVSREDIAGFHELDTARRRSLARTLQRLLSGYDALFDLTFPYSMGWHPAPRGSREHFVLHAHFFPPLLRAEARKFLVGYEMLAEAQRDITPEDAAARLRHVIRS